LLLLSPGESESSANICCYENSELLWVIKEAANINGKSFYTALYIRGDLNLYAYSINGIEYKLDYKTGKILSSELIK
jgi:hypothetical protein